MARQHAGQPTQRCPAEAVEMEQLTHRDEMAVADKHLVGAVAIEHDLNFRARQPCHRKTGDQGWIGEELVAMGDND